MENRSNVTEFVLSGLSQNPKMQKILLVVFLIVYIVCIVGNDGHHQSQFIIGVPMYCFLAHLSLIDACYSWVNTPKVIVDSFYEKKMSLFYEYVMQIFGKHLFAGADIICLPQWHMTTVWPSVNPCIILLS